MERRLFLKESEYSEEGLDMTNAHAGQLTDACDVTMAWTQERTGRAVDPPEPAVLAV